MITLKQLINKNYDKLNKRILFNLNTILENIIIPLNDMDIQVFLIHGLQTEKQLESYVSLNKKDKENLVKGKGINLGTGSRLMDKLLIDYIVYNKYIKYKKIKQYNGFFHISI